MAELMAPASVGIDFGTSNCTAFLPAGHFDAEPVLLEGESMLMPSVMFVTRQEVAARQIQQVEFTKRLAAARRSEAKVEAGMRLSKEALAQRVEDAMRRELAQEAERQYWDQSFFSMLKSGQAAIYGSPALKAYVREPMSGTLVRSPKSFIGSQLGTDQIDSFVAAIGSMLAHIKQRCETASGEEIRSAVIGRPVNYSSVNQQRANAQAISAMERAAKSAGFENVHFYLEPVAAALAFEQGLDREAIALIIDIGGGTTDCTIIRVGPQLAGKLDRSPDVLSSAGSRIGGTDFDYAFAWAHFMPLLGKGTLDKWGMPLPIGHFADAISILNVPAQIRFNSRNERYKLESLVGQSQQPELVRRLLKLHIGQLQYRLMNSSEMTKIMLSNQFSCTTPLNYIEKELHATSTIKDLSESSTRCLAQIDAVIDEALAGAGTSPDAVFITGGMGYSPIVREHLAAKLRDEIPFYRDDMLGSVGKGLGLQAAKLLHR